MDPGRKDIPGSILAVLSLYGLYVFYWSGDADMVGEKGDRILYRRTMKIEKGGLGFTEASAFLVLRTAYKH